MNLSQYHPNLLVRNWFDQVIPKHIQPTLNYQLKIGESLVITDEDMGSVMGHLKHNPEIWGYIYRSHPQYLKTFEHIKLLLPGVPFLDPIIVVHFEANWLLIMDEGVLLPAILQFNPNCRDGLCVSVYRLIQAKACGWLAQAPAHIKRIIESTSIPAEPQSPAVIKNPYVVLDLGYGRV